MDIRKVALEIAKDLEGKFQSDPQMLRDLVEKYVLNRIVSEASDYTTDLLAGKYRDDLNKVTHETITKWISSGQLSASPSKEAKDAFRKTLAGTSSDKFQEVLQSRNWQIFMAVERGSPKKEVAEQFDISSTRVSQICRDKKRQVHEMAEVLELSGYKISKPWETE